MVKTLDQIEKELAGLEQSVEAIANDLQVTYCQYLTALSETTRQQMILAAYRLCTQGYPEQFLRLSMQRRQELQQNLRRLAGQAQEEMLALLEPAPLSEHPLEPEEEEFSQEGNALDSPFEASELLFEADSDSPMQLVNFSSLTAKASPSPVTSLDRLLAWKKHVEQGIPEIMLVLSQAANRLLYQADILPSKLPEPVLEAATKSGMAAEVAGSSPNLLNLMIESKGEDQEEGEITRIVAIRLRLSEIEFGDASLTTWRSKLRGITSRLNQLERDYRKKQRERATAEAEQAWKAIWVED